MMSLGMPKQRGRGQKFDPGVMHTDRPKSVRNKTKEEREMGKRDVEALAGKILSSQKVMHF